MQFDANTFKRDFDAGSVFAYPTEAVFGLGCDPLNEQAVHRILELKQRPVEKGMILIAQSYAQIAPYVDVSDLDDVTQKAIKDSWPGPFTWLLPKSSKTPAFISGDSDMVAVRVTSHALVCEMCLAVNGPMVSTSANPATQEPARSEAEVLDYFGADVILIEGALGKQKTPSTIIHSKTMETIRS
ncbi:Sua5/YciO/YrdC/YwlC family protein [Glaciecola sp. XM2]|jgi:tRNA threonylcarbamoyl adenosine modification protein (Sua5/YciO/YrdC/YwlC family)|uniref:Sua5/YciO/YrdC/YwlC family protein n=1 Tax=Glaciecola sp. XM2 TaxID=1914931 RepID=UPI001BDF2B94|nr:Sua5/YciO/YrdC/YwlC family protein [Glaciecola sp. XM2]MBT1451611.1 Sua5/YciO/YrdC/YwlC family protein [Glaciecola sp. XM2]